MLPEDGREFAAEDWPYVAELERGQQLATALLDQGHDPVVVTLVLRTAAQHISDRHTTSAGNTRRRVLEPDETQAARKRRPRLGVAAERIVSVRGERR